MRTLSTPKIRFIQRPDVITSVDPITPTPYDQLVQRIEPDSSNRNRMQFRWALDLRKRCEFDLAFWLEDKKLTRQFTKVVRDAVRLYRDLEEGQSAVLRELFPDVVAKIIHDAQPASADFNLLMAEIADLKRRTMLSETAPAPVALAPIGQGAMQPVAPPAEDDDALLVVTKAKSDGKSGQNFLDTCMGLVQ